ncbi:MAG TPA: FUSC family protein [Streptosporangiaceae bacterium]|nr:FUSC family protein [Streptosporangiaceae bacterium]
MPDSAVAAPAPGPPRSRTLRPWPGGAAWAALAPKWSIPAAARALRATIVMPSVFALAFVVIGNLQMATFAAFGSFATLVLASFGGTRRDKAIAHLGLALVGSAALAIGTAVHGTDWLAALVTLPVAFAIFFGGVAGPNAASGATAALLAFVLPVASPGAVAEIPSRLAGWWLASVVGTAAVLLLSPRTHGDRLRESAGALATALAGHLGEAASGGATPAAREATVAAKHDLLKLSEATPYRPTGLSTADQSLANITELLEWVSSLTGDAFDGHADTGNMTAADRELLGAAARVMADVALLLRSQDVPAQEISGRIAELERARTASSSQQHELRGDPGSVEAAAKHAVHAQAIAVAAQGVVADALIASGRSDPQSVAAQRRTWYGEERAGALATGRLAGLAGAANVAARHASIRSVWFRSAARGAVALALAVAVADLTAVQHGFWVVLGTLSVLRANAAATGATVMRALSGTVVGFAVGSALMLAIGTDHNTLWVILPIAVLVAAYTPGTAPFAVGQAAFTVTVIVLFNLLAPAGWRVGLVRIQDVVLGCAVSLVVGVLFWPRGASSVVGDDLADALRSGAAYLTQAVDWSLGLRQEVPDTAVAAVGAAIRLEDALRGYLAEQGTKRASQHDLWSLVMATVRLRLTARSLAGLRAHCPPSPSPDGGPDPVSALRRMTAELTGFYERIAVEVGPPPRGAPAPAAVVLPPALDLPVAPVTGGTAATAGTVAAASTAAAATVAMAAEAVAPAAGGGEAAGDGNDAPADHHPHSVWVREHLADLRAHAREIIQPAEQVARLRRVPWWR